MQIPFENSVPGTFALALELQIVDQTTLGLVARGANLVADLDSAQHASKHIRSGMRQDFLELFSGEHEHPVGLLAQMREIKAAALAAALANDAYLIGGASHPWASSDLSDDVALSSTAVTAQTSFFGSKVQVGVANADQAIRLVQGLSMFVPHMVALSASSPFLFGEDTGLVSMRLQTAMPRMTAMPRSLRTWQDFERYMARQASVATDSLHWEIVPRPEKGVVEVQLMDAALTIEHASNLAGWIQVLSEWVLRQDELACPTAVDHAVNRYQATLFGLQASYVAADGRRMPLREALLVLMEQLAPVADEMGSLEQLNELVLQVDRSCTDEQWLRHHWANAPCSEGLVKAMAQRFDVQQTQLRQTPTLTAFRA